MIAILARSLRGRPVRTFLAISGIGTSTLLVLILAASFRSVRTAMASYAGQQAVDLWIAPAGSDNLIRGSFASQLELALVDSIRAISGVARADPIIKGFLGIRPTGSRDPNRRLTLLAIGYRAPDGLGGPPGFFEGRAPAGRREITLDRAAAFRMQVGVGDTVVLGNRKVAVSGLTTGTNIIATQFMFAEFTAAAARVGVREKASLILVQFAPGADGNSVTRDRTPLPGRLRLSPHHVRAGERTRNNRRVGTPPGTGSYSGDQCRVHSGWSPRYQCGRRTQE